MTYTFHELGGLALRTPRITMKGVLLLALPLAAVLIFLLTVVLRSNPPPSREREQREMEELFSERPAQPPRDPVAMLREIKKANPSLQSGAPLSPEAARSLRGELLKSADAAIVPIRRALFDAGEPVLLRMELISIVADMKGSASERLLTEVLSSQSLDEPLRSLALSKLTGRDSEEVFQTLRNIYTAEQTFGSRHLLLQAIGSSQRREATQILIEAARNERAASSRIQAIDSLTDKLTNPDAQEVVHRALFEDSAENVKLAAVACLGKSADSAADRLLGDVAGNEQMPPSVRKAAANWVDARRKK